MRYLGFAALAAVTTLTACGGEAENNTKAAAANELRPGQYEVVAEATQFSQEDEGTAAFNLAVGTRETRSICLGESVTGDVFAAEGMTCQPDAGAYIRGGSINATYRCTAEGRTGEIGMNVNGSFTAEGFEATRNIRTNFSGDGDVVAGANLTGRRTGDCTPAAAGGNEAAPANSN